RVHGSARDVVRRVHRHVENVRARNIRIETLRDRTREMARLADGEIDVANAWINGLFASAHVVTDLRCGTPAERSALPRPARRYESRRATHRGGYLAEKRGSPGQSRALERLRLLVLGRFVDEKILRGSPEAALEGAARGGRERPQTRHWSGGEALDAARPARRAGSGDRTGGTPRHPRPAGADGIGAGKGA